MANETVIDSSDSRGKAMHRFRVQDPVTYTSPAKKRVDGRFTLAGLANELLAMVESNAVGRRVRVKNTSGGTYAAGTLVSLAGALTVQTSATASNSPAKGADVTINISGSWEVGQIVQIVSGGFTDYAIITSTGSGYIVVDWLFYDHTTPVVTAEPAYEVALADADGANPADWVLPAAIDAGAYGDALDCCEIGGLDTSAISAEALVYLSATAGAVTNTAPTGINQIQQVVGVVKVSHASAGVILFVPGLKRILKYGSGFLQSGLAVTDGDKGDLTVSSSGTVWTLDNGVVSLAKMANLATDRLIGRDTAGSGVPEALTVGGGVEFTGSGGIQRSALTGDVTASAGSNSTAIGNDTVSNAKLANMTALSVKANATNASADPSDLAFSADGDVLMRIGTALSPGNFSQLTAIDVALDDALPISDTGSSGLNKKITVDRLLAAVRHVVGGCLTLISGTPISTSDVTAAGTLYFTPYLDNRVRIYDGTRWKTHALSEISLSPSLTSGSVYDVFVYDNAGSLALELSNAWTNTTTRSQALTTQDGVVVKSGATTRLYLGTIYASGTNTMEDSAKLRGVWNMYNRRWRGLKAVDTGGNYSWTSNSTWREVRGGSTLGTSRFGVVVGINESLVRATADHHIYSGGTAGYGQVGIGLDGNTPVGTYASGYSASGSQPINPIAQYSGYPGIGFHYYAWLERTAVNASWDFYPQTAGGQCGMTGMIEA